MKEEFLHYVWKFQKFNSQKLCTTQGVTLKVLSPGIQNHNAGPDFFNGRLVIDHQQWAGNIEIHLNSSHWFAHHHEKDCRYDSVILHVVWQHDMEVFRNDNASIATLELKDYIDEATFKNYQRLFSSEKRWIHCEKHLPNIDQFTIKNWLERLYIERLEEKLEVIMPQLQDVNNHWEALFFRLLCKNFGLKVNGEAFLSLATSVDFSIVLKCRSKPLLLEALFFGQMGLLNKTNEDLYAQELQKEYTYIKHKFKLNTTAIIAPKYFRLRPANFPTIRLSQLAHLYASSERLFSEVIKIERIEDIYSLFDMSASPYWDTHYNFGIKSAKHKKKLTKQFMDLLIVNTITPLKFCYARSLGKDITDQIFDLVSMIPSEANSIISRYRGLGITSNSVMESQALLQLKKHYCEKSQCMRCGIGSEFLKGNY